MNLAIIPARAGSKRIKNKNMKLLAGHPLLYYTISAAKKSKFLDKIIVSSDSSEILQYSQKLGVIGLKRPESIAQDKTPMIEVLLNVIDQISNSNKEKRISAIVLLQPTSPLRTATDIDNAVLKFNQSKCDTLMSVKKMSESPYWAYHIENSYLRPFLKHQQYSKRSQDLPKVYVLNGAIYIAPPQYLKKYKTFRSKKCCSYLMPPERSIDIDYPLDFKMAEYFLDLKNNVDF